MSSSSFVDMFPTNGGGELDDGSGTINPAALNQASAVLPASSPRGVKRSRSHSPETPYRPAPNAPRDSEDLPPPSSGEPLKRKRGRPPKNKSGQPLTPSTPQQSSASLPSSEQTNLPPTPGVEASAITSPIQQVVPVQAPKPTPPKPTVKALPTVRDHTLDQLTPEGDEYMPREIDEEGDKKVMGTGHLSGGREYKCRTFLVPGRGEKLFMLATECARVLGYRDSYLLFNKNRSLYKIIASQAEKDDLISQELLPYSYRSRQIAIVTARSMFRQFGSRVIVNGRRVRDDYWEGKARKQGFTEEDPAGEKRPGATKARLQQQQEAAQMAQSQQQAYALDGHHDGSGGHFDPMAHLQSSHLQHGGLSAAGLQLPMIMAPSGVESDPRMKEMISYRPRQEISGAPYLDQMRPVPPATNLQAMQEAADFNKNISQQAKVRQKIYSSDYWKPKSPPITTTSQPSVPAGPIHPTHSSHHQSIPPQSYSQQPGPGIPGMHPQASHHPAPHNPYSSQSQSHPSSGMGSMMSPQQLHLQSQSGHHPSHPSQQRGPPPDLSQQHSPYGMPPQQQQMWSPSQQTHQYTYGAPPPPPHQSQSPQTAYGSYQQGVPKQQGGYPAAGMYQTPQKYQTYPPQQAPYQPGGGGSGGRPGGGGGGGGQQQQFQGYTGYQTGGGHHGT